MKIHITKDGQTYGPYTLNEVNAALAGGELSPDDLAWHEGAPGWIMLGAVDGVVTPRSTRSMPLPPPVRSVSVADELENGQISSQAFGYAYSIIVAVGTIAEIFVHAGSQGKASLPFSVYLLAYVGIYVWERKQLSDPSLMPNFAWFLFAPAYLYKRAKAFRQPMGSFWTFNALLVLSIFIAVAQDDTLTRGARSSPSGDQGSATQQAPTPSAPAPSATAGRGQRYTTAQIKSALDGKSKEQVRNFFGRPPDQVVGERWHYRGEFYDADAQKEMNMVALPFFGPGNTVAAEYVIFLSL